MEYKRFFSALLLLVLLGCTPAQAPQATLTAVPAEHWWNDAIFYEIFVRSFNDSNEDGIGDFNGITEKLDYLQELGVNALWLMPIQPSPSYHGYDVIDYYEVNPQYGSMDDFKNLLAEAHQRDMHVIIDLVLNHTSSQHPFFQDANSGPVSEHRDWYVWSDSPGDHWHEGNGGYYYGFFWSEMPDLNYRNPDVTDEMLGMTSYWLNDLGIDGFRVDAAKHLIEEGSQLENTPATHEWLKGFYTHYKADNEQAYSIGEVYGAGAFQATQYTQQLDHIFNFEIASGIMNSVNGEANSGINSAWKFTLQDLTNGEYGTFLTNHDQNRVMSVFNGKEEKARLAAVLLLTAPGTPFIYYGEEIGMQGKKPDEDIRLPMQWSAEPNAGFSTVTPWREPDPTYESVNVAAQTDDPDSLLNLYRTLTKLRQQYSALRTGSLSLLETGNSGVYAILRQDAQSTLLVVANLKGNPISDYGLSLSEAQLSNGNRKLTALLSPSTPADLTITDGTFSNYQPLPELAPYQAYVFEIPQ